MTEQRTDFADLVRQRRAELGVSLRKLADQSIEPTTGEQPVKFGWLSKLERNQSTEAPTPAVLRALHVGLGVPLRTLQEAAAAQYLELESAVWSEDRTTRVLAARIEEMSDDERRQLAEIAETFARRRAQRSSSGHGKSDD
ncbi:XRE family transcriptional regulator [Streptomyces longwoodensis]|uniref:helix-turn-helix domain-containing protein n=1 Tax=Streptomyces longwoodensis TaxID=68231 RepID=UPI003411A431